MYSPCLWEKKHSRDFHIPLLKPLEAMYTYDFRVGSKVLSKQHFSDFLCNVLLLCQKLTEVSSAGKHLK